MCLVYAIKSSSSGRIYIGQTENMERRLMEHNNGEVRSNSMGRTAIEGFERPQGKVAITIAFANTYETTPTEGAKRRYPAHFLSKLTDSDGELQETLHWLETAKECSYISINEADELMQLASQVGRQLGSMINRHESFCF